MSVSVRPKSKIVSAADADEGESCYPMDDHDGEEVGEKGKGKSEDDHGEEDSGEVAASRTARQPRMPSEHERREHEATHCPFRSWPNRCPCRSSPFPRMPAKQIC